MWCYTHVPQRTKGDAGGDGITGRWDDRDTQLFADRVEARVERFAPGFGELVLARTVQTPRTMPQDNRCLHSGAVNSGTAGLHQQLVLRPVPGLGRPETPIESLYLASASAHPGGGVHGAPGANAARAAVAGAPSRQARACGRRPAVAGLTATGLTGLVGARRPGPRGVIWLTAGAVQTCGPDRVPPCRVRIEAGIRRAGEARRDGELDERPWRERPAPPQRSRLRWVVYLVFLLALLGINWWMADNALSPNKPTKVAYSFFYQQVHAGNVANINWTGNAINGTLRNPAPYPPGSTDKTVKDFATERPLQAEDNLTTLMLSKNVVIDTHPPPTTPFWQEFLLGFGPTLLLLVLIVLGARAMSRGWAGSAASAVPRPSCTPLKPGRGQRFRTWPASTRSQTRSRK